MELYMTIRRAGDGKGYGRYEASIGADTKSGHKHLSSGGFPTIESAKKWGRQWAKAKKGKLTIERIK